MNETIGTEPLTIEKEAFIAETLHVELLLKVPKPPKKQDWEIKRPRPPLTREQKDRANERRKENRLKRGPKIQTNYNSKITRSLQKRLNRKEYIQFVSDDCSVCGTKLPNTVEYYELNGNYCVQCCRVSEKRSQNVRMAETDLDRAFRPWLQHTNKDGTPRFDTDDTCYTG